MTEKDKTDGSAAETHSADPANAASETDVGTGTSSGAAEAPKPRPALSKQMQALEERIVEMMMTVYDPEIPVNIYELGMIYEVDVTEPGDVHVRMTLTSPACPVAGSLPGEVEEKIKTVEGVTSAKLDLVWDPPWNPDMMSDAAKLQLGMM